MKKLISLILSAALVFSLSTPALATKKFDTSVFDGRNDILVSTDEMTGKTTVEPYVGLAGSSVERFDDGSFVSVNPTLLLTDSYDYFCIDFLYISRDISGMDSIIIKIGDNRYNLSNCYTTCSTIADNQIFCEEISFFMKKQLIPLMNDLIEHQNDEIKVRINGKYQTLNFSLNDEMKRLLLVMYDLYISGGGTREKNMHDITAFDKTVVSLNGKKIVGNVFDEIIEPVLDAALSSY